MNFSFNPTEKPLNAMVQRSLRDGDLITLGTGKGERSYRGKNPVYAKMQNHDGTESVQKVSAGIPFVRVK